MSYIEVNALRKRYKVQKKPKKQMLFGLIKQNTYDYIDAVSDLSFSVEEGEILGLIGPNGAGKSTTIKLLSGILMPDNGTCIVDGMTPWENRKKYVRNIGVMFGQRSQLLWDLPPQNSFALLKGIYNIDDEEYEKTLSTLVSMLELEELMQKPVRQLSLGQRIRCELAATFIHKPKLVFLDEPTIGIDIEVKKQFHKFVKSINRWLGTTIIITTHDLDDIQSLCKRLIIINKGQLFYDGTLEDLLKKYPVSGKIHVETDNPSGMRLPANATISEINGSSVTIDVEPSIDVRVVVSEIAHNNIIKKIYAKEVQIEDVIISLYKEFKK